MSNSNSILIGIRQRPSVGSPNASFLDIRLAPEDPEKAKERAMAMLFLGDREAWAHEMGIPADEASIETTQECAVCQ